MKKTYIAILTAAFACGQAALAQSGYNNFFGQQVPGGNPGVEAAQTAAQHLPPGAGDYTDDEKRMQKKYKSNVKHAKRLIAKGEKMMKAGEKKKSDKLTKKGKIIMEIGEKRLNHLKENNPFPDSAIDFGGDKVSKMK